jgi:endonuclease/exonuclease/phosphatase family metal-dependent hydrolase
LAPHRHARRPHLLVGDFNANAPEQRIDPALCKPTTRQAWAANGGGIPRRVVQRLLDAGYVDSLHAHAGAAAANMASFTTLHPGQRVDYVFCWGVEKTRIESAWIETDRLAKYASDHFPVGVEIAGP